MTILSIHDLHVYYGKVHALRGINLSVEEGEIVTLLGSNGAGKSTTLHTISGLLRPREGEIQFAGTRINSMPAEKIVNAGISHSPEGRKVFATLTVDENLNMGAYTRKDKQGVEESRQRIFSLFPRLEERRKQMAGTLSGGEQQMLAIGRALMSTPQILMLDEPSLGLAPVLVRVIFDTINEINKAGVTVLLVEQNARAALRLAHRAYVLETGRIALEGSASELLQSEHVRKSYLAES